MLLLTTLGTVMVAVDSTIVILALPTMSRQLASPLGTIIWTILAYLLVTAALTTQAGRFGDLFGRGRVYNVGFAVFTVGSALCGFAPTDVFLIAARVVQALGGAIMFANAGALIAHVFPPERRGQAFGFLVFGWSVGLDPGDPARRRDHDHARLAVQFLHQPPDRRRRGRARPEDAAGVRRSRVSLDVPGFAVFSVALGMLCYGAIEVAVFGASWQNIAIEAVGLALVPVFVLVELRAAQPMLDLRELRQRLLGFSLIAGFLQALGNLSVVFLLTLYLQGIRGLSPLDSSLLLVPGYLVGALAGPVTGRYVDRLGPRGLATAGLLLMVVAVLAYDQLTTTTWLGWIPVVAVVSGVGTGMFFPANNTAVMGQASPRSFGAISGLRATLTNMGALLSFVVALSIASASVSKQLASEVFLGTNTLGASGGAFLGGIRAALLGCAAILVLGAVLSYSRGPTPVAVSVSRAVPSRTGAPGHRSDGVADDPTVVEGEGRRLPDR